MSAQQQRIRRYVWTGAIAAVTATGAWYGAGLKTQQEVKQLSEKRQIAPIPERIAQLEEQRVNLVRKGTGIERKIRELEARNNGATRQESKVGGERR